jgi:hypothetical protein
MKDVNIEHGTHCFSGLAVVKHSKERFIELNVSRTFIGVSDEETTDILSDVYDRAVIAVAEANKPPKIEPPVTEPVIDTESIAEPTEGKERGIDGTSASKKPAKKNKG